MINSSKFVNRLVVKFKWTSRCEKLFVSLLWHTGGYVGLLYIENPKFVYIIQVQA